jgi:toxin ParE1/3/4
MHDLEIAAEASRDLEDILQFSIEQFGNETAVRYFNMLEHTMMQLRSFPRSGPIVAGITPKMRCLRAGSHRIFYTCDNAMVTIRRVLHQAMRPDERLGGA